MAEDKKQQDNNQADQLTGEKVNQAGSVPAKKESQPLVTADRPKARRSGKTYARKRFGEKQEEFEQRVIDIARVTRVMAGGKRMRFRACVAIGNRNGRVAIGVAKGADVTLAITKAVNKAKKNFIEIPIVNETIPHEIYQKYGAARILFKPARRGRGIIAGGAVRMLLELSGVKNIVSKILGTSNKVNNVKCTIIALKNLKRVVKIETVSS